MEVVWKFIIQHWYFVLWLFLEVVFGVLLLLKKSKSNEPLNAVFNSLPRLITYAENKFGAGHGIEKKEAVLSKAVSLFKDFTGIVLKKDCGLYKLIAQRIEEILRTPQKKEDK